MNREQAREHTQGNFELGSFFFCHRREPRIVEGGGAGRFGNRAIQRSDGFGIANASPKLAPNFTQMFNFQIKSSEDAASLRE